MKTSEEWLHAFSIFKPIEKNEKNYPNIKIRYIPQWRERRRKLVVKSNSLYYEAMKEAIAKREKPPRNLLKWKPQSPAGEEK